MTNALIYLLIIRLKNLVKSFFRSPAKLIYAVLMIALLVFSAFNRNTSGAFEEYRPMSELSAIVTAFYILVFCMVFVTGLTSGSSIFKLPDVNFIFTAPAKPQTVLFYGIFQQLGTSLLMGFFVLYQYSWMNQAYGVTGVHLLLILVGYSAMVFLAQISAMLTYMLTSSSTGKKRAVNAVFYGMVAAYGLWIFLSLMRSGDIAQSLAGIGTSLPVRLFPVGGWIGGAVGGLIQGSTSMAALGGAVTMCFFVGACVLTTVLRPDYYEDVLQSAETTFTTQQSAKEGKVAETAPRKLKVGKTGLPGGEGASVFYYKHLVENKRSRTFILSGAPLIFAIVTIGFGLIVREFIGTISFGVYMQFFSVTLGRFVRELTKPYIYLVPEPPFKKILWSMAESVRAFTLEAVVVFVPICFFLELGPVVMVLSCVMRLSFSMMFLAVNLVSERLFGSVQTKTLIMLFYIVLILIFSAPGVILAVFLGIKGIVLLGSFEATVCLALTVCNVPITLLSVYLCRNILQTAELR